MCRAPTDCWGSGRGRRRIADSPSWRSSVGSLKAEHYTVWDMHAVKAPWQRRFRRCGVLSDHELHALREIERRLRWKSPELVRLFDGVEPLPDKSRGKRARAKMLVASAAFAGLALLGPRML